MRHGESDRSARGGAALMMDSMRMEDYIAAPDGVGAMCMDDDAFIDINISDFDPMHAATTLSPRVRSPLPSPSSKRAHGGGGRKRRASSIASDDFDAVQLRPPPALRKVEVHPGHGAAAASSHKSPSKPKALADIGSSKSFQDLRKSLVSETPPLPPPPTTPHPAAAPLIRITRCSHGAVVVRALDAQTAMRAACPVVPIFVY
jgi:hypothetical protein